MKVDSSLVKYGSYVLGFANFKIKDDIIGFTIGFARNLQDGLAQLLGDEVAASTGNSLASTMTKERCTRASGQSDVSFFL
jgi:hypothetical protein